MALPVYTMNCFKLPKGICEEINGLLAKYWWSKGPDQRNMHWVSWERLSLPKKEGGLGFKDLEKFNVALLGKQAWRILQSPESLLSRLLKGRYFASNNLFNAAPGKQPSYAWRSILEGRDLLKQGMRYLIGDGESAQLWLDPWLPTNPPRAPRPRDHHESRLQRVSELFQPGTHTWDLDKLQHEFQAEDADIIKQIHLSVTQGPDLLGWHYTTSGFYTVKSGYWLAIHSGENRHNFRPPDGLPEFKEAIWKITTAPKLKHFLWRILSNTLATGSVLTRRRIISNPQCKRCCMADETIDHLFFTCHHAQLVWRASPLPSDILISLTESFETKFRFLLGVIKDQSLTPYLRQLPLWILWRLWKSRNLLVFQHQATSWLNDFSHASYDASEWAIVLAATDGTTPRSQQFGHHTNWKRPPTEYVKCNHDCNIPSGQNQTKAAWIFRDCDGFYLGAGQSQQIGVLTPLEAELQALLMAMQNAWSRSFRKIIFEGDNKTVLDLVLGRKRYFGLHNWIKDIKHWQSRFEDAKFLWTPRQCSMAADCLARNPLPDNCFFRYFNYVPGCIIHLLHVNHIQ